MLFPLALALLSPLLTLTIAGPEEDAARLGQFYTDIPVYRTRGGNNVVTVGLGDPVQELNLTLSTNVEFILVASEQCDNCLNDAEQYISDDSRTLTRSQRALSATAIYPTTEGAIDVLQLKGNLVTERITDGREDSYDRVIGLISDVDDVTVLGQQTRSAKLPDGVSGFFGLGVYKDNKQWSIMPSLQQVNGRGAPAGVSSYVVGFDMAKYSRNTGDRAGSLHFGGVPSGSYTGNFNWVDANTSVAASWGMDIDRLRVAGKVVDGRQYYASLDPAFDAIYMPESVAVELLSDVSEATRDTTDPTRWNVPCDAEIAMTVTIGGREYNVDPTQLVQQRGASTGACWSTIVAWQPGSLPETLGEIRLGTPFLSGVYAAIYYSEKQQLVGIAGKPDSVNDFNALAQPRGKPNGKLAGILIGSLLAVLIVLLIGCYARNRNSFQSVWYRAMRRQHRAQMNAVIRAATIPPPMMGPSMVIPPPMMAPGPMGPMGPMGPGGPMGVPPYMPVPMGPGSGGYGRGYGMGHPMMSQGQGGGWQQGPPMYQAPMQPSNQHQQPGLQHNQNGQIQGAHPYPGVKQPASIEHTPRGQYSSRHHSLPLPHTGGHRGHSPNPPRYSHPIQPHQQHHNQPHPSQSYGPRHGDVHSGRHGQHEGLLQQEQDLGDGRYHNAPTGAGAARPNQKLHFGGIEARQYGGGGPEPSMIQRDRMVAAQERIEAEQAAKNYHEPPLPPNHPLVLAREAEARDRQMEEKKKRSSWRSWASKDKGSRLHWPSTRSETGVDPVEEKEKKRVRRFDPPPKPSSTWIKSHHGDTLGFNTWRRSEREKAKRTGILEQGGAMGEQADSQGGRRNWYA